MAGPDVLPWASLFDPGTARRSVRAPTRPPARGKCLPHAAGPHEVNEVTFVKPSFDVSVREVVIHGAGRNVATTPCGPRPARPRSREQGPAGRKSRKRAVATVLLAQAHR